MFNIVVFGIACPVPSFYLHFASFFARLTSNLVTATVPVLFDFSRFYCHLEIFANFVQC